MSSIADRNKSPREINFGRRPSMRTVVRLVIALAAVGIVYAWVGVYAWVASSEIANLVSDGVAALSSHVNEFATALALLVAVGFIPFAVRFARGNSERDR